MFTLLLFPLVLSLRTILTDETGDAVSRLLKNVTFHLPDQTIDQKEGLITIKGTMKNITCDSISLVDFDISSGQSETTKLGFIDILADGLALHCHLIMDLTDPSSLTGDMDVSATYTKAEDSSLNFRAEFGFNSLDVPIVASMSSDDCAVDLVFDIDLTHSNWPSFLVPVLEKVMKKVLKSQAPTLICDKLKGIVGTNGTQVLNKVASYIDPMLNGTEGPFQPENPPSLPSELEFIDFEDDLALKVFDWFVNKNVNGKPMIDRLIDLVVPDGTVTKSLHISPIADISADFDLVLFMFDSFSIFDVLTPVSKKEFPDYHPNNHSLCFHMKLDTLGFNMSGNITNTSSKTTTPFAVSFAMSGLETKLVVQVALQPLKNIMKLPELSIDCIMTLNNGSTVQLLDFSIASMKPTQISSPNGLLVLGDELVKAVEMLYGDVLLDFIHGFAGTVGRNFLNQVLTALHDMEPGCDAAPTPSPKVQLSKTYWIETISSTCVVAFIVFIGLAYLIKRRRRNGEKKYSESLIGNTATRVNH